MGIYSAIRAARDTMERDAAPISLRSSGLSLENPAVSLSSPAAYQLLSGSYPTVSGESINTESALRIGAVYACIRVIGSGVAGMPAKMYSIDGANHTEAVDHPLYYLLTQEPNPEMTAFTFFDAMAGAMALTGNGYALIERNPAGQVVALWPIPPRYIEPKRKGKDLIYVFTDPATHGETKIAPADIIHVPLFCFDGLKGYNPVDLARQGLGLSKAAEKYAASYFGTGGDPGGIMSTSDDIDLAELTTAKTSWDQQRAGSGSAGKTVFVAGNWKYEPIAISQRDAQFIESRKFQREEICALWGVPAHMVGDPGKLSNGNWEQQALSLVVDTLSPYAERITQELHRKLLGKTSSYKIAFDPTVRLRADRKSTMESVALSRQWATMTTDESRQMLGLNPLGGDLGSMILAPVNMMPADRMLKDPQPVQPTQPENNSASLALLTDCIGRYSTRSHRDADTVRQVFGPAVQSIVEVIATRAAHDMHLPDTLWTEPVADEVLRMISKREQPDADKILRSIILSTYREAGAALAEGKQND